MQHQQHSAIVNFIWGIADDVLRDVYTRGKYRDVILPMVVTLRTLQEIKDEIYALEAEAEGLLEQIVGAK
jgi:type I restriction enzyme M protein